MLNTKVKIKKNFTYKQLIIDAINSFPNKKATSNDIFTYAISNYPDLFTNINAMTWKNNIRQLLSKCCEFVRVKENACICKKCNLCLTNYQKYAWMYISKETLLKHTKALKRCLNFNSSI